MAQVFLLICATQTCWQLQKMGLVLGSTRVGFWSCWRKSKTQKEKMYVSITNY